MHQLAPWFGLVTSDFHNLDLRALLLTLFLGKLTISIKVYQDLMQNFHLNHGYSLLQSSLFSPRWLTAGPVEGQLKGERGS